MTEAFYLEFNAIVLPAEVSQFWVDVLFECVPFRLCV